jgi:hypothetical protein
MEKKECTKALLPRKIPRLPVEKVSKSGKSIGKLRYCRRCDTYYYVGDYYSSEDNSMKCPNCGMYDTHGTFYPWDKYPEIDLHNIETCEYYWKFHSKK